MLIRLSVFDIVGTTVISGDEVPHAFRDAFLSVGVALPPDAVTAIRGRSKREAIATLLAAHGPVNRDPSRLAREVYSTFQELLRRSYETSAKPIPGAEAALTDLRDSGVAVVLNTGLDRETTERLLRALGWDALGLGGVVTGDDVQAGRPAPDLIRAAMRLVGEGDPLAVVSVGDTVSDLEAAHAAGVGLSVGVLTGAHGRERLAACPHSAILDSVADLPGWLRSVGAMGG